MRAAAASTAIALVAASAVAQADITYPLYKQCDPRWGSNEMGVNGPGERATICEEGCAMSSAAMALAGLGVELDGSLVNPGSLNTWLEANEGYKCLDGDCNNLVLDSITNLTTRVALLGEIPPPIQGDIVAWVYDERAAVLAHVRDATHFVLLTGWDEGTDTFYVNDPGFNQTSYNSSSFHDLIVYTLDGGTDIIPSQKYPLYKQCDPRWGPDLIVSETVCAVGCLMSSTSSALAGHGILLPYYSQHDDASMGGANVVATPGSLNAWLKNNGGYTESNDFIESSVAALTTGDVIWNSTWSMHTSNDIPVAAIMARIMAGQPVIANVLKGRHFVLVVGWVAPSQSSVLLSSERRLRGSAPEHAVVAGAGWQVEGAAFWAGWTGQGEITPAARSWEAAYALGVDALLINDSGFNTTTYSYSQDVVGWRLFNMTGPASL